MVDVSKPNWKPLEEILGGPHIGPFMYMYATELLDGTRIHAYKHSWTRRYLFLSEDGRSFEYLEGADTDKYRESDLADVLPVVLPRRSEWLRDGGYDHDQERDGRVNAATILSRASYRRQREGESLEGPTTYESLEDELEALRRES